MGILSWLTGNLGKGLIDGVKDLVDEFVTTEQERMEMLLKKEQLTLEREKAYLQDIQSARQMQIAALRQEDRFSKRFIYYFAFLWTLIAAGYVVAITFLEIPEKNLRFADTTLGFMLGTIITQIIAFFYGSSLGSKYKEKLVAKAIREKKGIDEDEDDMF